ncbi:MAG: NYN domain-containing protein [Candidatus Uhrbacteria bacterium]
MIDKNKNFAFIDSTNLYLAIKQQGWNLDYHRFRVYLKDKYGISKAYMFVGFVPENHDMYRSLQEAGFILQFKPVMELKNGEVKGNCDAELVLQAMIDFNKYDRALIVTGDGDFHCLVRYLVKQDKLEKVLAPTLENSSVLLRKAAGSRISFISDLKNKLEYKKRTQ